MALLETADMLMAGIFALSMLLLAVGSTALPYVERFMSQHGVAAGNFKGETIPSACGGLIWMLLMVELVLLSGLHRAIGNGNDHTHAIVQDDDQLTAYALALTTVAFIGFIDDAVGSRQLKGFSAHCQEWTQHKRISTGLLKAGGTIGAAIAFVFQLRQDTVLWQCGLQVLLLAMMTNGLNLLDLRPGRALKVFFFIAGLLLFDAGLVARMAPFVVPVFAAALVLFGPDLQGRLMLGDTGANLLGFAAGCWSVMFCGLSMQVALLAAFLLLHGLARRSSLSRLIERNRALLWIDLLGRGGTVRKPRV